MLAVLTAFAAGCGGNERAEPTVTEGETTASTTRAKQRTTATDLDAFWTRKAAESYGYSALGRDGLDFYEFDCNGIGAGRNGRSNRFRCQALDDVGRTWYFTLRPLSADRGVLKDIRCEESRGSFPCDGKS